MNVTNKTRRTLMLLGIEPFERSVAHEIHFYILKACLGLWELPTIEPRDMPPLEYDVAAPEYDISAPDRTFLSVVRNEP